MIISLNNSKLKEEMFRHQLGIANIFVLVFLVLGLGVSLYLVNLTGSLKLFPKAATPKNDFLIGANTRGAIHYGYGDILPYSQTSDVDADLSEIKRMGGSVVRVFVANNQIGDEEAARRLGEYLTKAESYGISVIPMLIDFYNTGFNPERTEQYYSIEWNGAKTLNNDFFLDGYKDRYLSFVKTVVEANRDHSNIYAWEPGNELKNDESPTAFIEFMKTVSSEIKKIDPDHSIATGMINAKHVSLSPETLYPNLPDIDIIGIHQYDNDHTGEVDIDWAMSNGKKSIIEELGFSKDRENGLRIELSFWKNKGVDVVLQWGFVAKDITRDNGDMDKIYGMDNVFHSDYDALFEIYQLLIE